MLDQRFSAQLSRLKEDYKIFSQVAIHEKFTSAIAVVTDWRFSTSEYFDRLPYEDERQGYASPKLVRKKYKDFNEARWLGKFCAGFVEDRHIITIRPEQQGIKAVSADLYEKYNERTNIWRTKHRWNKKFNRQESNLISLARFETLSCELLYIGVGPDDEFAIYLYTYSTEGVLLYTDLFAKNYLQNFRWTYYYDNNGELFEIKTGSVVLWPKSN